MRPSFIWKYCTKLDSNYARCQFCGKTLYFGRNNTANITKHLRRLHSHLMGENQNYQNSFKMDDETMQATASLANQTTYEDEEQTGGHSITDGASAERRERRGPSYVWNYVEKLTRHTIRCKLCTKVMSFHGTANLITHLQRRHNVLGESGSQLIQTINAKQEVDQIIEQSDDQDEYDDTTEHNTKKYGRKNSASASIVWKYCTRISREQVRCSFCKKNLSYQGTSNLQRHLHRMHGVITQGRLNRPTQEVIAVKADKLPTNLDFIWDFCTQEEEQSTRCNMCDSMFETRNTEAIVKHLTMVHSVEINPPVNDKGETIVRKTKKRNRQVEYDSDDDGDLVSNWSKLDDHENDQQIPTEFDETNIKKDDSLYDDIIVEENINYDEENVDHSLLQEMPSANPLSPHSSSGRSVQQQTTDQDVNLLNQIQQSLQPPNLLPPLETKVLLKLQEDRLRMETDYFREKAGFYRLQKYLTALQAKKIRVELDRFSNGEATIVTTADLNNAYAVEVIPAEQQQHMNSQ